MFAELLMAVNRAVAPNPTEYISVWIFGVPILIVVLVDWLKHSVGVGTDDRALGELLLDISIDVLTIGVTIVVTYFQIQKSSISGFRSLVASVIVLIGLFELRRRYLKGIIATSIWRFLTILLCLLASTFVTIYLYKTISLLR